MKQNCWEFKNCGRQPGGHKVNELGLCSAATETKTNGINDGNDSEREGHATDKGIEPVSAPENVLEK